VGAATSAVEVAGIGAIEHVEAVHDVLGSVAVYDVQEHRDAHTVSRVYQLLQFLRCAVTTGEIQGRVHAKAYRNNRCALGKLSQHRK